MTLSFVKQRSDRRAFIKCGAGLFTSLLKPISGIAIPAQRTRPLQSSINQPIGIAANGGRLIVGEYEGGRLLEIDLKANWLEVLCGDPRSKCPGLPSLKFPRTIAFRNPGEFFVVESRGILAVEPDRCRARYIVSTGLGARQLAPAGAVVDAKGAVYYIDRSNRLFRMIEGSNAVLLDSSAGLKCANSLNPLALLPDGDLVIAASGNQRVYRFSVRSRRLDVIAGTGASLSNGDEGPAIRANLRLPMSVTVDAAGNIFIGETGRVRMVRSNDSKILTVAVVAGVPGGLAVVGSQLYVADPASNVIRAVNLDAGTMKTIAGNGLPHRPTTFK